jgi:ABC-2 type transport system ATP-binding protein
VGPSIDHAIEVRALRKEYPDIKAVDGIDFDVESGQIFSLLGPNGAGKTTTVEILEGLRDPTAGTAKVFGADVTKDYRRIRERVGVLPQDFEPFDRLKPREAVEYWSSLFDRRVTPDDIARILETVGLTSRANTQGIHLSGGEKRRLGIAMSLVGNPDLVFLDEPTTGLDPGARRELWGLIGGLKAAGKTVLLTTHYLDEAEHLADQVAIMNKGRIVAHGTPEELITRLGGGTTIVLAGAGEQGYNALQARGIAATVENGNVLVHVEDASLVRWWLAKVASIEMPLREIYTRRPSLEDVFLKLIGARMREGELAK